MTKNYTVFLEKMQINLIKLANFAWKVRNIFPNRTIGVNLGSFRDICRDPIIDAAETPYQKPPTGLGFFLDPRFYKDAVPTELKRALKSARFPRRIRFGCDADGIWACTPQNRTYRTWV